jgi:hypothetical protein
MLVVKILASNKLENTGQQGTEWEYNSEQEGGSLRQLLPLSTEVLSVASVLRK